MTRLSSLVENRNIGGGGRKVPLYVVLLSLFAASGGLMFGYDIGISGGVAVMDDFLCQFFPWVLEEKITMQGSKDIKKCNHISKEAWNESEQKHREKSQEKILYCLFGNQYVQLFFSSLYLAAMMSTLFAAYVSRKWGRKMTIILASIFYLMGIVLNIVSSAFWVLIFGRIMLGFGAGFGNQAIPLFISEIAPAYARGALNHLFQLNLTIGIFFANIVNWRAQSLHPWGWRLSLGLAGIPALLLTIGSFFLVETPSNLVQRGLHSQAKEVLNLIRGKGVDTNLALQDIIATYYGGQDSMNGDISSMQSSSKKRVNGFFSRSNIPPLVIAIFVQLFKQFSGINVMNLYAPALFKSFGLATNASLLTALIIDNFKVVFTLFSIFTVDRIGRRRLLLIASGVMFFTQLLIGIILIASKDKENLKNWHGVVVVALLCAFVSAFACSWGPLGWLISTEIFPLACRSEGQSVSVFFDMLFTFVIAHTSLSMFCTFKLGIFFFFALWSVIMGFFAFLFLPETMNMEIEIITYIWSYHKFWKHFVTCPSTPSHATPTHPQVLVSHPSPNSQPPPSSPNLEMGNINNLVPHPPML